MNKENFIERIKELKLECGKKLTPLEVYDISCYLADSVLGRVKK